MNLLITDLDNTLYDWVTYFAHAFDAMTRALKPLIGVPRKQLLDEFKAVHQRYGNSEQPFAVLELPSVQARFRTTDRAALKIALDAALHVFNSERKRHLALYPSVRETLEAIRQRGVKIVGYTEAIGLNAMFRLRYLGIERLFERLYVLEGQVLDHPESSRSMQVDSSFIINVPRSERKPNPRLLLDICRRESFDPQDACYLGDSLCRDIAMAKDAGVMAIWAKYGTEYDRKLWDVLVRVTHWTEDDVRREESLREHAAHAVPDYTLGSFSELLSIVDRLVSRRLRMAHG